MVATLRPGTCASMPNTALPSTLAATSNRGAGVPIKRNCAGVFSFGLSGGVRAAAAAANSP